MQKKYTQTWALCLIFTFSFLIIPFFVGIVLLTKRIIFEKNLKEKYGDIDKLEARIKDLQFAQKRAENDVLESSQKIEKTIDDYKKEIEDLKAEEESLTNGLFAKHYEISEYSGLTSEECKNKLSIMKSNEQKLIEDGKYYTVHSGLEKKKAANNIKQLLRCYNAECDNVLNSLTVKGIESSRNKITKSYDSLNKIFELDGVRLNKVALESKLEELNLVYTYELKKEQEREIQKAIKEQMLEEEKVRREIEKEKAKIEKDQQQCSSEINRLMQYMQKTESDVEKQLYIDKIRELEEQLKKLESDKETVLEREANARAGFVYVISNIGSFGSDIYKIGMTRRLEPMDRVKELSSASVPFDFDVHAMIFSNDAPGLEALLHQYFEKQSVNKVNLRKEFFKVTIDEIEKVVKEKYNNTVEFTRVPVATDYRRSLEIQEELAI